MKEKLFLLSKEEYEKYKDIIHPKKEWWWLRSQGNVKRAVFVGIDGDLCESHIALSGGICPAIYLKPEALSFLPRTKNGKYVKLGEFRRKPIKWQVLDEKTGLCLMKKTMDKKIFDAITNYYEDSVARKFLKYAENYFREGELALIKTILIM